MKTFLIIAALAGAGQTSRAAVGADPSASQTQVSSVLDFVQKGGMMMIPIGICSLVALAVIVERGVSLRRRKVIPPGFLPGLEAVLNREGSVPRRAIEYCQKDASPVARVFAAGLKRLGEPPERLEKHVQEAAEREVLKLRKYTRVLSVIASVAPLMGLLGTIFGMIRAFQTVATSAGALGRTELLARGIYEALITTAAGLLVAIPALLGYHWIAARVERLVSQIDQVTVEFFEERPTPGPKAAPSEHPTAGDEDTETAELEATVSVH